MRRGLLAEAWDTYLVSTSQNDQPTTRLRFTRTAYIPLVIAVICALPLAMGLGVWGLLVLLPFVLIAIAIRRLGVDIAADEVRVRALLSTLRIPRAELTGFAISKERHVQLMRVDGSSVHLPTVRPRDLPALRAMLFAKEPRPASTA